MQEMANTSSSTQHPLAGKHIIVAGGGIAGLAFARALDQFWPENVERPHITLFERRDKVVSRDKEGYSMSIRSDPMSGGMQALQKLSILDDLLAASITGQHGGAGSFNVWDANWNSILRFKAPKIPPDSLPAHAMRIARYVLRQGLIDALPETVEVHCGVGCTSASVLEDGGMRVVLTDGSERDCDLLVAADGANSAIRAAIRPDDTLNYAGAVAITATGRFPDGLPDVIKEDHGIVLGGDGASLFASPIDDYSAIWSVSTLEPTPRETLGSKYVQDHKHEILEEARLKSKAFSQPFGKLIDATDTTTLMVMKTMDKQPIDHTELAGLPVVFIGDANHAVSPFAGNGANMALMDGVDLAVELSKAQDIKSATLAFDGKSRARSKRTVDSSHLTIKIAHSTSWRLWMWKMLLRVVSFMMSFR